ncbi:hypothetical protein TH53_06215 [Pedobacter lusitanus]|uniref:Contig25, whole genome shotgun sequence n=1 Tax=Pedobacter lusitanus TaxID=1503925 RepID=A0A0D0GPB1_9SPHI|nr:nuclear transport factor 2 family protein [Pedobacter lusitanus]KIO78020.1 hypothetical protein TH53_06215 [Pedobacter lusitanus]
MKTAKENTAATTELIETYFRKLLVERDIKGIIDLYSDQVDFNIPGNTDVAPWVGRRKNKTEIAEFYDLLVQYLDHQSFIITNRFIQDNQAVITGNLASRVRSSDKVFKSDFSMQFTQENGLITHYLMLEDSYALVEAIKQD